MKLVFWALIIGGALLSGPLLALAQASRVDHGLVLVIGGPGPGAIAAIVAAGGRSIGPAPAPFAVLAYSDQPGFARALQAAGAWLVVDARALAALCKG